MASPAELVEAVSVLTGLPHPTVVDIDRRLVAGGLRSKTGRGRNAARMTPLDAVRLLTAILTSPQANLSVEAVRRYEETVADKVRSSDRLYAATGLVELTGLPARHSFVAALEALIVATMNAYITAASYPDREPQIEVFAFTRATQGRIRLSGLANGLTASVEYRPAATVRSSAEAVTGDLEQSRRITKRTILGLARLLGAEGNDD